jgi:phenol/toluene 2-monooxygenase (NADH) P0/A0
LTCEADTLHVNINPSPPAAPDAVVCDLSRKFVRVLRESADGLVAFEFAIGWPDLAVELAMPRPMFEEFCIRQQVERLADDAASPTLGGPRQQDDAISGDEA